MQLTSGALYVMRYTSGALNYMKKVRSRVYLVPRVVRVLSDILPSSRLGSSLSRCVPAATNLKVYAEHYASRAASCKRYHIGSLQELPYTVRDPAVPLLVAVYGPR
jgi:hypothetical protein